MRVLVHDYCGHPFQVQLSRALAARGHAVVHSYCAATLSGRGRLDAEPGDTVRFEAIGVGGSVQRERYAVRLLQELGYGRELLAQVRRERPDVVLAANLPVMTLTVLALGLMVRRVPWVLWHQDVHAVALRSFAGQQLSRAFVVVARVFAVLERWASRRAAGVVVIADSFLEVHREWGTEAKTVVIPNWAPLDEIVPRPRHNAWSAAQGLDDVATLLYSGTLGLKHDPGLLVQVAAELSRIGSPVRLVVVNEGPAQELIAREASAAGVEVTLLPFQPYEDLPDVLGAGDVLVVLLERSAGAFSVPSKTLSYLCAGRPVLGLVPKENLAAELIEEVEGCVLPPDADSVPAAAAWVADVLADPDRRTRLGEQSRALAEREFALEGCTDRFEAVLRRAVG